MRFAALSGATRDTLTVQLTMPRLPRKISVFLLVLVFTLCVYRARTQPLTTDEAHCFRSFVDRDLSTMAREYDACNHVLHTLLTKFFRWSTGISEFELRLSSLIGCALYLIAVFRLTALCFAGTWMQPLAAALLTLNPLVLDFMVASRGYGLALALLLWSFYCATAYWTLGREQRWLWRAGVCAGLSIAANLTMLIPVAALGAVMLLMALRYGARGLWPVINGYAGPAIVIAFVFLVLPLLRATNQSFYYGAKTFREASYFTVRPALIKIPGARTTEWVEAAWPAIRRAVLPVVFGAIVIGAVAALIGFLRRPEPVPYKLVPYLLFAGTLAGAALIAWVLRRFEVPYPMGRTALYFIPLFTFPLAYGALLLAGTRLRRLRWAPIAVVVVLVGLYATQIDTRFFTEWRYDATGMMLRKLRDEHKLNWRENRPIILGVSHVLEGTVEYYRRRRNIHWLGELVTKDWDAAKADYYLLITEDEGIVGRLGLEVVHADALSRSVLARRRR